MKIISDFHDYYDSVMSMGIDKECIYLRKRQEIIFDRDNNQWLYDIKKRNYKDIKGSLNDIGLDTCGNPRIENFLIGFCGNIYPCIKAEFEIKEYFETKHITKYYYKKSDEIKPKYKSFFENTGINFFDKNYSNFNKYFLEYKTPIFILERLTNHEIRIILNPKLKQFEFFKIKDSYTAYQEIYSYMSGVLGSNNKEIIEVSDKTKIIKHGYDNWNFKTRPKKK